MRVPGKSSPGIEKGDNPPARKKGGKPSAALLKSCLFSALLTIGLYYSCTVRPEKFWLFGFSGYLIPPAMLVQLFLLFYCLWKRPVMALIPGLALFLGMRFIQASIGWHYLITEKCNEFKVLSLNAKAFGAMEKPEKRDEAATAEMVKKIKESEADIICIQEMHDFPGNPPYNVVRQLKKAGYRHSFYSVARKHWGSSVGMAIFSKHPILEKQVIRKKEGSNNQIILARIRMGERRISVINMHLQSVALNEQELSGRDENKEWLGRSFSIGKKLKKGFQARASQIDDLLTAARNEGNYLIICGDMNDTPYSNSYLRVRNEFRNSFEEKGKGLGFTFNGPIPFLRIDNQFFARGLRISRFETRRDFEPSDHHATEACYSFAE